jgi:hypothetical protein
MIASAPAPGSWGTGPSPVYIDDEPPAPAPTSDDVKAEREACAKIVENFLPASQDMLSTQIAELLGIVADSIRARSEP